MRTGIGHVFGDDFFPIQEYILQVCRILFPAMMCAFFQKAGSLLAPEERLYGLNA